MHRQIEKNKHILWDEMERVGSQKMTPAIAERLAVYRDAYKALHMLCEEDMQPEDRSAHASEHKALTKETALEWPAACRTRTAPPVHTGPWSRRSRPASSRGLTAIRWRSTSR